jgi:hypothetical protein
MNIITKSEQFTPEGIEKIEAHYDAKYVCETCVKRADGWMNDAVVVFYQDDPSKVPEGGSQWFGLYLTSDGSLMITNAISAVETDIDGIVANNGDVIYSKYRHDFRYSPDGSVMIDGGRDYTKHNNGGDIVTLRIVKDKLTLVEDGE